MVVWAFHHPSGFSIRLMSTLGDTFLIAAISQRQIKPKPGYRGLLTECSEDGQVVKNEGSSSRGWCWGIDTNTTWGAFGKWNMHISKYGTQLGLKAKIPVTWISTKYAKHEGRKDEENGWVSFQNPHWKCFGAATLEMSMKKKSDHTTWVHISV